MKGRNQPKIIKFFFNIISASLKVIPYRLVLFLYDLFSDFPTIIGVGIRSLLLTRLAIVGDNIYIGKNVRLKNLKSLTIGSNVSIHENCFIDAIGGISIGDNVSIAHNTSLVSFEHTWNDNLKPIKYNQLKLKSIKIDNDVWIGCGCRLLAGTVINTRSVVAAGAITKCAYNSNKLIAGIPAKEIKSI